MRPLRRTAENFVFVGGRRSAGRFFYALARPGAKKARLAVARPDSLFLMGRMWLVFSTFPDTDKARLVGQTLVKESLAACVTLLPKAESFFIWKGEMQEASEVLAIFKTSRAAYPKLEARLNELHPYDVPEIIALPVERGLPGYVDWVVASVEGAPTSALPPE